MRAHKWVLIIPIIFGLIPFGFKVQAQSKDESQGEVDSVHQIVRVEAKYVCMGMGTNRLYKNEMIPAVVDGKTYYGCCDGCKNTLLKDPESRVSIDPVTGAKVDKATAVIGALPNGVVHYFESEKTMQHFVDLYLLKE